MNKRTPDRHAQHGIPSALGGIPEIVSMALLFEECDALLCDSCGVGRVDWKDDGSLLSEADLALTSKIQTRISEQYPRDAILSEEGGEYHRTSRTWVVDPLDGTTNFIRAIPIYCISIALVEDSGVKLSGVFMPALGSTLFAAEGKGAYDGLKRLSVSSRSDLDFSCIVTLCSWRSHDVGTVNLPTNVRAFGSTAYHLSLVASGATEGTIELGCRVWDFAAGSLLVKEAGGVVCTSKNLDDLLDPRASNEIVQCFAAPNKELLRRLVASV